ncbi:unnamed protein product [marine sediment metagenome]|uniref:Uncharacterized protein n=1 Tax=marine sediment metagenome TaxID=412755 RepID=X1UAN2_9ZZZZ
MSKNKKVTKVEENKFEGLKVVGGKESYNPAKKKKVEEEVFTSPVKINDKEYIVKPFSMLGIKKLNIERKKLKPEDEVATYDFSFHSLLTVLKKFNPEMKDMTTDEFEEMVNVLEFERVQAAILQISGLKKYFKLGASKK